MNEFARPNAADPLRSAAYWFAAWLRDDANIHFNNNSGADIDRNARCHFSTRDFYLPQARVDDADAAIAHFYAHWRYGGARFDTAALKPIQIVLVSIFEDARVEQLALRARPGLRRLWVPYIDTLDCSGTDVPALLRRLIAALFDPQRRDGHFWIDKAQRLFFAGEGGNKNDWHDPVSSRYLGNVLGNDLGQMRLQFNWKSYRVEPIYRDDHRGLWQDAAIPEENEDARAALHIDADGQAIAQRIIGSPSARAGIHGETIGVTPADRQVLAKVEEWDYARRISRAGWVTVRAAPIAEGDNSRLQNILRAHGAWLRAVVASIAAPRSQIFISRRRQWEGDALDLDACVHFTAERGAGMTPLPRIYSRRRRHNTPRALVVLIDASLSSADAVAKHLSQLDCAIAVAWLLAHYAEQSGDRVAVYAFQSEGRDALHLTAIKTWAQAPDVNLAKRLCGLQSNYSTRLGAALRHVPALFATNKTFESVETSVRELIVLSDGEVSDIDSVDARYLPADAQHAVQALRHQNIEVSGVGFGPDQTRIAELFGSRGKSFHY